MPAEVAAGAVKVIGGVTTVGAAGGGGGAAGSVTVVLSARAGVTGSNIKELNNSIAAIVSMINLEFILHLLNDAMP